MPGIEMRYREVDKAHWDLPSRSSQSSGGISSGLESEHFLEAQGDAVGHYPDLINASAFKLSRCHFPY